MRYFVTGANGHLGSNLIKNMIASDLDVTASVRNMANANCIKQVVGDADGCKIVECDLENYRSINGILSGVDVLIHCAAVFKHWAKAPDKEIVDANLQITKNILSEAAKAGVSKVVYVSSIVALDYTNPPMDEKSWNRNYISPYNKSKTLSEELAWDLSKSLNLDMVAVLPAAIVGGLYDEQKLTPTMGMLQSIAKGLMQFDINFVLNYIGVDDVAKGILLAADKGVFGERYILGNENPLSTLDLFNIMKGIDSGYKIPQPIPKEHLMLFANNALEESKKSGKPPVALPYVIEQSYGADVRLDLTKSKKMLGFDPEDPKRVIRKVFEGFLGKD